MILVLRAMPILLAAACLVLGSSVAADQVGEQQIQPKDGIFVGIHKRQGVGGRPSTVRITDGTTFIDVTEQEYRERGYTPLIETLPVLIIQRLSPRVPASGGSDK
jgi:hypothetical protein